MPARVSFVASPECEALLDGMDQRLRLLPSTLVDTPERCLHAVRGPVLWSETITARANSFGDEDVFVCRTVRREFDCMENRLLVWLLERAASVGRVLRREVTGSGITGFMDPGTQRRTEELAARSKAWRTHPRLISVPPHEPSRMELTKLRRTRGSRLHVETLLAARKRASQPFSSSEVAALVDASTAAMHEQFLDELRKRCVGEWTLECTQNVLSAHGMRWHHPDNGATAV